MGLVESLHAEIGRGPIAAALAARDAVACDPAGAATIADDADLDMAIRVAALLALALVAQDDVRIPDPALAALEDDLLIDAVLAIGATSAITGLLCAGGARVTAELRRYLAVRIKAAGASGMHVASLLVEVGDTDAAVHAAVPTLREALHGVPDDDPCVLALAMLVDEWSRRQPGIAERIGQQLHRDSRAALERALRNVAS